MMNYPFDQIPDTCRFVDIACNHKGALRTMHNAGEGDCKKICCRDCKEICGYRCNYHTHIEQVIEKFGKGK